MPTTTIVINEKNSPILNIELVSETTTTTATTTTSTSTTFITTTLSTTTKITTTALSCMAQNDISLISSIYLNQNKCSTRSVYEPEFLNSLDSVYSNGYPIIQKIVCYGTKFELRCARNQKISILSTYYGIQSKTNTKICAESTPNEPALCYRNSTFNHLINLCNGITSCTQTVNELIFGDPCIGFNNKQLFIQYQCLDHDAFVKINSCPINTKINSICHNFDRTKNKTVHTKYWCDASTTAYIECDDSAVINILCAFYGLDPNLRCKNVDYTGAPTACYSNNSFEIVQHTCNGLSSCSIMTELEFENVCSGYSSMLYIQWECVNRKSLFDKKPFNNNEIKKIPLCKPNYIFPNITTCPSPDSSFSPYIPQQLINSTTRHFDYPIYEQRICQNGKLVLACPINEVLHIRAAYFGIQSHTTSQTCTNTSNEVPEMCFYTNSFDIINSTCEYKNKCYLKATPSQIGGGDLCPNFQVKIIF